MPADRRALHWCKQESRGGSSFRKKFDGPETRHLQRGPLPHATQEGITTAESDENMADFHDDMTGSGHCQTGTSWRHNLPYISPSSTIPVLQSLIVHVNANVLQLLSRLVLRSQEIPKSLQACSYRRLKRTSLRELDESSAAHFCIWAPTLDVACT